MHHASKDTFGMQLRFKKTFVIILRWISECTDHLWQPTYSLEINFITLN